MVTLGQRREVHGYSMPVTRLMEEEAEKETEMIEAETGTEEIEEEDMDEEKTTAQDYDLTTSAAVHMLVSSCLSFVFLCCHAQ